jgi:hypothetical protein
MNAQRPKCRRPFQDDKQVAKIVEAPQGDRALRLRAVKRHQQMRTRRLWIKAGQQRRNAGEVLPAIRIFYKSPLRPVQRASAKALAPGAMQSPRDVAVKLELTRRPPCPRSPPWSRKETAGGPSG